jgi:hypothetical protein
MKANEQLHAPRLENKPQIYTSQVVKIQGKVSNIFQPGGVENRVTEKNLPMGRVFICPNITLPHLNSRCSDLSCGKYFLFCEICRNFFGKAFFKA